MLKITLFRWAVIFIVIIALAFSNPLSSRAAAAPEMNPNQRRPQTPQVAGDELWGSNFLLGANNDVFAIAIHGTDIYVGGDFTQVGTVPANHVAKWNTLTHQWSALGSGVNNRVYAIAVSGSQVYVGGVFNLAGGQPTGALAVWDTNTAAWSKAGNATLTHAGWSPAVYGLAIDGAGSLFVGGTFDSIGGINTENIARWNGATWSAVGSGLGDTHNTVYALAASGSDVYAGGDFKLPSWGVAHWNGSGWSGLGSGTYNSFYPTVDAIAISGGTIYIGGSFDTVNDGSPHTVNHVAAWNGTWTALGAGTDYDVYTLAVDATGSLYAGGQFSHAGGNPTAHIAAWNGLTWATLKPGPSLSDGMDKNVIAIAVSGNELYAGGAATYASGVTANHIARWDISQQNWFGLGNSLDSPVTSVAVNGSVVYLGGSFNSAGGVTANAITAWNAITNTWSGMGGGLSGCNGGFFCTGPTVNAIAVSGPDVYVTGNFTSAGGVPANNIARWNTTTQTWFALGGGLNGCAGGSFCSITGNALVIDAGCVYVGGTFNHAGLVTASNLAQFCSGGWSAIKPKLESTEGTTGPVYALVSDGAGGLYIGGLFPSPATNLAYTDFYNWFGAGEALNGAVRAIALRGNDVYASGDFTNASLSGANHIARLVNGAPKWTALGNSLNDIVTSLAWQGSTLVAGGLFTQSGALGVSHVARWDGANWAGLGAGVDGAAWAVATDPNFVYAGGAFFNGGGKPATYFDRWGQYMTFEPVVMR